MKSPRRLAPSPPPDPRGVELPLGLVVSPDGKRAIHHALVVGDTTFTRVRVWNLAKGTSTTRDLGADLMAVEVMPSCAGLVATRAKSGKTSAVVVDPRTGKTVRALRWPGTGVLSPTGDASVQHVDNVLAVFGARGERWAIEDDVFSRWIQPAWATPELVVVASQHPKDTLTLLDARTGDVLGHHRTVKLGGTFVLAPGGARVVIDGELVNVATGRPLKRPLLERAMTAFAWSADATVLAAADATGRVTLLGADATKRLATFSSGMAAPQLAWFPDGSALAIADGKTGALAIRDELGDILGSAPRR